MVAGNVPVQLDQVLLVVEVERLSHAGARIEAVHAPRYLGDFVELGLGDEDLIDRTGVQSTSVI